ncbi:DNA recombination protein RmuC [Marinospirillum alkaliphilum]|uniref:DNA recombination protein RmuC n=1 Tax=Marinospirillum alkaliphilum DSM 21637 TaxID=1122209 RepID=A0A1K1YNP9_9GAMM|nr:DNA recombination protein RmuC [Marinospirillum alkaliphilum]SFX63634.1 DNA recombination protein RmuC [Marinospirillum alkaliphilum DSM 21637]
MGLEAGLVLLGLVLAAATGAVGYFVAQQRATAQMKTLEAARQDLAVQLGENRARLDAALERQDEQRRQSEQQQQVHERLQQQHQQALQEAAELKTTLEKREEHFREQMQQLAETRQSLTREFENLANRIFEEKGKTFTHTSQASMDQLLKPFREQIEGFQKRINEVHDASLQGNTSLNAEIRKVLEIGLQMSKEANNLTSALKGDSQQRGAWGEAQLRRTLEMSGLIEDAHYEVQSAFKDAEGRQKQTDYLIKLPDGKHLIIDSKVALNAYDRAVSAETPEAYDLAMSEHIKAVRRHIDELASKDYTNLIGMRSPGFVLMFMPVEPAYIEALKQNRDLFEYGYKKGVVLVSHTTLIPILRTVSNLWMMERSNSEAREISERAGEIYNQVSAVAERLAKLGGTLNTASNHYNSTVTALVGKQGLYGKVERFNQLSVKVSKTLPPLEPTQMDFETERLSLIVEAIEEKPDQPTPSE